jgi:hypothetical protein
MSDRDRIIVLQNSIRARQVEIRRLTDANRENARELKQLVDIPTWLTFLSTVEGTPSEIEDPDYLANLDLNAR